MTPFKKTALAAVLATAAPLAAAADQQTGGFDMFLSGGAGYTWFSDNGPEDYNYELRGSIAYTDKSGFGVQIDNVYQRQGLDPYFDYSSSTDFAGHVYYRTNKWLAGAFWQNRSTSVKTGIDPVVDAFIDASMDDQQFYGIEAQGFFGDLTLYGQLGQHKFKALACCIEEVKDTGTIATIQARYFLNDNWRVEATYVYDDVSYMGVDLGAKQYGVSTEYRLANSPVSLFGQYMRTDYDYDYAPSSNDDRVLVGVRLNFGKESLRKRDRDGASLNPVPTVALPITFLSSP